MTTSDCTHFSCRAAWVLRAVRAGRCQVRQVAALLVIDGVGRSDWFVASRLDQAGLIGDARTTTVACPRLTASGLALLQEAGAA